jgi:hypothetical protein
MFSGEMNGPLEANTSAAAKPSQGPSKRGAAMPRSRMVENSP